ncbi:MAG: fumarylacetoacetate hydrolase family protein [Rikenellaceae bacterium]
MKIICIERNYSASCTDNNIEPSFFMKPDTALLRNNEAFYIPSFASDFRCNINFVVKSNRVAKAIKPRFVERCFDEVGLAVNFETADVIEQCYDARVSCDKARCFDHSTALSPQFMSVEQLGDVVDSTFCLKINEQVVVSMKVAELLITIDRAVSYVSDFVTLKIGDLILMGQVEEGLKICQGDKVEALLNDNVMLNFEIR